MRFQFKAVSFLEGTIFGLVGYTFLIAPIPPKYDSKVKLPDVGFL